MNNKYLIINPDNTAEWLFPENGDEPQLQELQAVVGGYVEWVRLTDRSLGGNTLGMYINEEGKFRPECKPNPIASWLFLLNHHSMDIIMGRVVIALNTSQGNTAPLDEAWIAGITSLWKFNDE